MDKTFSKYFLILIAVWLLYSILNTLAPDPVSVNRFGLTLTQVRLLRFTILLPMLFIWTTALFSVIRFWQYTKLLGDAQEAFAFKKLTLGLLMLLLVIALPGLINSISIYFPDSMVIQRGSILLRNYLTIGFYLYGFWNIWRGSKSLLNTIDSGETIKKLRTGILIGVALLSITYIWAIFHNPYRSVSNNPQIDPTYYVSDPLIILTIILPYILVWFFGSMAILNLWSYAKKVPGIIYRNTFTSVAYGLTFTIVFLIFLQFLTQANAALNNAALSIVLVIIYMLLLAISVGYILVARGARKLTVIEEVE